MFRPTSKQTAKLPDFLSVTHFPKIHHQASDQLAIIYQPPPAMASATLVPPYSSHASSPLPTVSKSSPFLASLSISPKSYSKNPNFCSLKLVPQQGLASFSSWNGLRPNGISISLKSLRFEKKRKHGRKGVYASLFGVGAPEALVIGVVALLVFGPKGLAEEVSREFKSTLEKEIGLDELQTTARSTTSNIPPTLSSTPPSENSAATPKEMEAAATANGQDAQVSETLVPATEEDPEVEAIPVAASGQDAQVSETLVPATEQDPQLAATSGEDSEVAATPAAATPEDSQVAATPVAATNGDSQAATTTPVATTNDSQATIKSNSVEEVGAGVHMAQRSEDVN
ncbi:hypothetical protein OSB04_017209 [Centaurea solstitialis]|uniref:Sec-independent protein translocase protein TATB, chloroplastic n=1 Tax=Centaurea solstitialis TaxID=347529 RepID=A0AA38T438_9ASTR|nr:hypothetical protein OSB04_017209 [Centaurea solstitialis]